MTDTEAGAAPSSLLKWLRPVQLRELLVISRLAEQEGVRVYLVGGPVRDLLLRRPASDLDLLVEGHGPSFATILAGALGGSLRAFERFGTATVGLPGERHLDVATSRAERYPRPGALPEITSWAPLEEDLARRDFTINAMAVALNPDQWGVLYDPLGGRKDLQARVLRVTNPASFREDPTRLVRAAAFSGRFGLTPEPTTFSLLQEAAADFSLATLSAERRNETLRRLLSKTGAHRGLCLLSDWGLLEQLYLGHALTEEEADRLRRVPAALTRLGQPRVGRVAAHSYLYLVLSRPEAAIEPSAAALALARSRRQELRRVSRILRDPPPALVMPNYRANEVYQALHGLYAAGAVAVWLGLPRPARDRVERYWCRLRKIRPDLGGLDLINAGLPPGPQIARGLRRALAYKLDHPRASRESQLAAALRQEPEVCP